MSNLWRRRDAKLPWMLGALLALSLTVVAPRSRTHHLSASFKTARVHHLVSHRTLVDQSDGRLDASIKRARRAAPPGHSLEIASAAHLPAPAAPLTSEPARPRLLRRLRMAPAHAGGSDPLS